MELNRLRAEFSRLADRYPWLRHAYATCHERHVWSGADQNWDRVLRHCLGENTVTPRRIVHWNRDLSKADVQRFSVFLANAKCTDFEATDAFRQFRALAEKSVDVVDVRSTEFGNWRPLIIARTSGVRDGIVMGTSPCSSNLADHWIDHLHATLEPARSCLSHRVDTDNLVKLEIFQLHCSVFEASAACLQNVASAAERTAAIPAEDRTRPMSLADAAKFLGKKGAPKDRAKWLRACIDDGTIQSVEITRQSHIFSKQEFSKDVWPKILPAAGNSP